MSRLQNLVSPGECWVNTGMPEVTFPTLSQAPQAGRALPGGTEGSRDDLDSIRFCGGLQGRGRMEAPGSGRKGLVTGHAAVDSSPWRRGRRHGQGEARSQTEHVMGKCCKEEVRGEGATRGGNESSTINSQET